MNYAVKHSTSNVTNPERIRAALTGRGKNVRVRISCETKSVTILEVGAKNRIFDE
jgi:hypothetical protein